MNVYILPREVGEPSIRNPCGYDVYRLRFHAPRHAQVDQVIEGVVPAFLAVPPVAVPAQHQSVGQNLCEQTVSYRHPLQTVGRNMRTYSSREASHQLEQIFVTQGLSKQCTNILRSLPHPTRRLSSDGTASYTYQQCRRNRECSSCISLPLPTCESVAHTRIRQSTPATLGYRKKATGRSRQLSVHGFTTQAQKARASPRSSKENFHVRATLLLHTQREGLSFFVGVFTFDSVSALTIPLTRCSGETRSEGLVAREDDRNGDCRSATRRRVTCDSVPENGAASKYEDTIGQFRWLPLLPLPLLLLPLRLIRCDEMLQVMQNSRGVVPASVEHKKQ